MANEDDSQQRKTVSNNLGEELDKALKAAVVNTFSA